MAHIIDAVTSFPEYIYEEAELRNWFLKIWPHKKELIEKTLDDEKIKARQLSLPINYYRDLHDIGKRNVIWKAEALRLQGNNIKTLLERNEFAPENISLIASVTSSGLTIPDLSALMMEEFSFSPFAVRLPLFGLGGLGGVSALNRVHDFLSAHPEGAALIMASELHSLNFQLGDDSESNIVETALYGDGAGLVLMVGDAHPLAKKSKFKTETTGSVFFRETEKQMGLDVVEEGVHLAPHMEASSVIAEQVVPAIKKFLIKNNIQQEDLHFYATHLGGHKIISLMAQELGLVHGELDANHLGLYRHGDLSSASIINVLEELNGVDIAPGTLGLMMGMGHAYSMEMTLLKKGEGP